MGYVNHIQSVIGFSLALTRRHEFFDVRAETRSFFWLKASLTQRRQAAKVF
jgi:hypothetical protein